VKRYITDTQHIILNHAAQADQTLPVDALEGHRFFRSRHREADYVRASAIRAGCIARDSCPHSGTGRPGRREAASCAGNVARTGSQHEPRSRHSSENVDHPRRTADPGSRMACHRCSRDTDDSPRSASAQAADGPFSIDGIVPDSGTTLLTDLYGNVKSSARSTRTPRRSVSSTDDAVPTLGLTNPNGQVDLRRRGWTPSGTPAPATTGCTSRGSATPTAAAVHRLRVHAGPRAGGLRVRHGDRRPADRKLQPVGQPRAGDFMILWDQQGSSLDLYLRTWSGIAPNLDPERTVFCSRRRVPGRVKRRLLPG
jgi:hypothetical protein